MKATRGNALMVAVLVGVLVTPAMAKNARPANPAPPIEQSNVPGAYAAIAFSPSTLAVGMAQDHTTQAQAEAAALERCTIMGEGCQIANWTRDACTALAIDTNASGGWGAAWGTTFGQAAQEAQTTCQEYNEACQVFAWTCNANAMPRR